MKTSSLKAKGRALQQLVRDKIIEYFNLSDRDVLSTSMGDTGADVKLSEKAVQLFPYDIECKNQERVNVWDAYKQVTSRAAKVEPLVVIKRNKHKPLVLVDLDYFISLHKRG